jgi:ribosomal peptide maturation radical SAM protein 1
MEAVMKICFVAPPGFTLFAPSLALSKLRVVLTEMFPGEVEINIKYLNMDYFRKFGSVALKIDAAEQAESIFRNVALGLPPDTRVINTLTNVKLDLNERKQLEQKIRGLPLFIASMVDEHELGNYDLVGITTQFSLFPALAICSALKVKSPSTITVLGGAMVYREVGYAWVKHYPTLDFVASGPSLISFPKLIRAILDGNLELQNSIPGILNKFNCDFQIQDGEENDINMDPEVEYNDFLDCFKDAGLDVILHPRLQIEASRGCKWGRCKFCNHKSYTSTEQVQNYDLTVKRINSMFTRHAKHKHIEVQLIDAFVQENTIKTVLPKVKMTSDQCLLLHTRASLDDESMRIMAQSGVRIFQPGIESLNDRVLSLINKGTDSLINLTTLKRCLKHGILPSWNYLTGVPMMTDEDYQKCITDLPLFFHLYPPSSLSAIEFIRWSAYWNEQEAHRLCLVPMNRITIAPYNTSEFAFNTQIRFMDANGEIYEMLAKYHDRFKEVIDKWRAKWLESTRQKIPRLFLSMKDNKPNVYDTREQESSYALSPSEIMVLDVCNLPTSISMIAATTALDEGEVKVTLSRLCEMGFVFSNGSKFISLVLEESPEAFIDLFMRERERPMQMYI